MVPKIGIGKSIVRVIQYNFMVFTENTAKMDVAYQKITSVFWPSYKVLNVVRNWKNDQTDGCGFIFGRGFEKME